MHVSNKDSSARLHFEQMLTSKDEQAIRQEFFTTPTLVEAFASTLSDRKWIAEHSDLSFKAMKVLPRDTAERMKFLSMMGSAGLFQAMPQAALNLLKTACENDDSMLVQALVKTLDPAVRDIHGNTPLHYICRYGSIDVIRSVLQKVRQPGPGQDQLIKFPIEFSNASGCYPLQMGYRNRQVATQFQNLLIEVGILKESDIARVNENGDTPLICAIREGKEDAVRSLIQRGVHAGTENSHKVYPLMVACYSGNVRIAELLLNAGASRKSRDSHGKTALIYAAGQGHEDVLRFLIQRGVAIHDKDLFGDTALMCASNGGHTEAVKLLLEAGAGVNVSNDFGTTPLLCACYQGHIAIAELLLNAGANNDVIDKRNNTPLGLALEHPEFSGSTIERLRISGGISVHKRHEIVFGSTNDGLFDHFGRYEKEGLRGPSAHSGAAQSSSVDAMKEASIGFLMESLKLACKENDPTHLQAVLEKLDLTTRDSNGNTPLHHICRYGSEDLIRSILRDKVARRDLLEIPNARGMYPLQMGYQNRSVSYKFQNLLIEVGILKERDIARVNENGDTPLICAIREGKEDAVRSFLQRGVHAGTENSHKVYPLMVACYSGHAAIAELLLNAGASRKSLDRYNKTALIYAAGQGHEDVLRLLIKRGVAIHDKDLFGDTALMCASNGGHIDAVRLLIEAGAGVNVPNDFGTTPLLCACYQGHIAIAELLLDAGANNDVIDKRNNTPLSLALEHPEFSGPTIERLRISSGISVHKRHEVVFGSTNDVLFNHFGRYEKEGLWGSSARSGAAQSAS